MSYSWRVAWPRSVTGAWPPTGKKLSNTRPGVRPATARMTIAIPMARTMSVPAMSGPAPVRDREGIDIGSSSVGAGPDEGLEGRGWGGPRTPTPCGGAGARSYPKAARRCRRTAPAGVVCRSGPEWPHAPSPHPIAARHRGGPAGHRVVAWRGRGRARAWRRRPVGAPVRFEPAPRMVVRSARLAAGDRGTGRVADGRLERQPRASREPRRPLPDLVMGGGRARAPRRPRLRDRDLRHDAVLGPHGPAPAADPRRPAT